MLTPIEFKLLVWILIYMLFAAGLAAIGQYYFVPMLTIFLYVSAGVTGLFITLFVLNAIAGVILEGGKK